MQTITVKALDDHSFEVQVEGGSGSSHLVTVRPEYARLLTEDRVTTTELVRVSFEFLLARESNTSILRSFDLAVIARYFPDYEHTVRANLRRPSSGQPDAQ